jgi:hypothetical protein
MTSHCGNTYICHQLFLKTNVVKNRTGIVSTAKDKRGIPRPQYWQYWQQDINDTQVQYLALFIPWSEAPSFSLLEPRAKKFTQYSPKLLSSHCIIKSYQIIFIDISLICGSERDFS